MAAFEVIALDTATPQLRAPGASDTYTFPRAVELPLGTANGVLFLNGSKVVTSGSGLVFDASGNLGLGVAPSAWGNEWVAQQFKVYGAVASWSGGEFVLANNSYESANNVTSAVYRSTNPAQRYRLSLSSNAHIWEVAPSGTAGNPISFTQAMTLDVSGRLGIGTTSPAYNLDVLSNGRVRQSAATGTNSALWQSSNTGGSMYLGLEDSTGSLFTTVGYAGVVWHAGNYPIAFGTNNTERARIPAAGGMVVGTAALATAATDGFLYVPTCAGTPTGTPTTQTGTAPIVVDTTNNKLYFYSGGQWRDAGP